jgi:uncharacterized delta-60 repeat protein
MKRLFSILILVLSTVVLLASCGGGGGGGGVPGGGSAMSGSLDTTFGTGGTVITSIGTLYDAANAVAIQKDGKLVAAGFSYTGIQNVFALVRYNTDGSLDTTFNTTGKVTTPIGTVDDAAEAVAIQSDGKIVAAGYSSTGSQYLFAVARYLP